jgi:hypothetical protein
MAVEHVVLIKPKAGVSEEAVTALWAGIGGLQALIPGITGIAMGGNSSPEQADRGFTIGFIVTFADAATRDAYLPHPDHVAVVPLVLAVAEETLVFDLER